MSDSNVQLKVVAAALAVVLGLFAHRWLTPATTFAADGIDPYWDSAAQHSRDVSSRAVVLFTADWCPACRALHANVLSRDDVSAELRSHYAFHAVDMTDSDPRALAHARKCNVSGIPLLIRYDKEGRETSRTNYLEPQEMIAWLQAGE